MTRDCPESIINRKYEGLDALIALWWNETDPEEQGRLAKDITEVLHDLSKSRSS